MNRSGTLTIRRGRRWLALLVGVAALIPATRAEPAAVATTIPVGGQPLSVAANANTNRIYVSSGFGPVTVIDDDTRTVVGSIPVGLFARVAVNPATNRLYVTDNGASAVLAFDGTTTALVGRRQGFVGSAEIAVNSTTNRVYSTGSTSSGGFVSVLDGTTMAVLAIVALGHTPEGIGVNEVTNRVYVANRISGTVSVVDGAANAVVATVPIAPPRFGLGLKAVAVDSARNLVFVTDSAGNEVVVVNGATNEVLTRIPVGLEPLAAAVDASAGRLYVANHGGSISIIDTRSLRVVETVSGFGGFRGIAVNSSTSRVYAASGLTNSVLVIQDIQADTTPPETSIAAAPGTRPTRNRDAEIAFTGQDDRTSSAAMRFTCTLDGTSRPCSSPFRTAALTDGVHRFQVVAIDEAGNRDPTPAIVEWTVDATPPTTVLEGKPAPLTNLTTASFAFRGDDNLTVAESLGFRCSLDGVVAACSSPFFAAALADGQHAFSVAAVDAAGNEDARPAHYAWTVDSTPPDATAMLEPLRLGDGDDGGRKFIARWSCSDALDPRPIGSGQINGIEVDGGTVVHLIPSKNEEARLTNRGILNVKARSFSLTTLCTDAAENVGTASAEPDLPGPRTVRRVAPEAGAEGGFSARATRPR